ncbi:MAG: cytochrome b/b6 domain-containing protein [Coriobacteriia bacterium]|nr:cytochrome b/b6 domain-containing protein [Coriobacteriia bacterium]
MLTGLCLFVPGAGKALGIDALRVTTLLHRVFGAAFVAIPLLSYAIAPQNLVHSMKNLFRKWDDDDKVFMKYFFAYLFNPKKYHMPKQHFVKSGQRISDMVMYFLILVIAITGILLWVGPGTIPLWLFQLSKFGHDLAFFGMGVEFVLHLYLGAGMFQPYRRLPRVMFGDGYVLEADALYHWGHWAEEELTSGENVVVK